MPEVITGNSGDVTENDDAVSLREYIAGLLDSTGQRLARLEEQVALIDKKVDHLDEQAHELRQWVDGNKDVLETGLARLRLITDPMARLRGKRHAKETAHGGD